jgi:hypothetical protein
VPRPLYPFFINEAAYYETNVAFMLAGQSRRQISVAVAKGQLTAATGGEASMPRL